MTWFRSGLLLTTCALSACSLAPAYHPPHFILPASYQGAGGFTVATPEEAIKRGSWWETFKDPTLNGLEQQAAERNPDLAFAETQYLRSREYAAEAAAGLYPDLGAGASVSDNKQSMYRLFRGAATTSNYEASNIIQATASWEPDFWGEIGNRVRAQKNMAQATAADGALVQLSLEAEVADDYFALRGLDEEIAVYMQAIGGYQKAVSITEMRLKDSLASGLDVARAESQLASAQAQLTATQSDRALMQHAIADLVGLSASSFALPSQDQVPASLPAVPMSVPDQLLQRRPDIAEAERTMAAANRTIGVARAAFYPNGTISAIGGFQDNGFNLLSLPNSMWSVGAAIAMPLFEGGLRQAALQDAWAAYAQTRDQYRATVLAAFQDVEDQLTLTEKLATEGEEQQRAWDAAEKAQNLSLTLYTGGLTDYLSVVIAQEMALEADIATVEVQTAQLQASVNLIRALGGGWSTAALPPVKAILPGGPLQADGVPSAKKLESPAVDNLTTAG